ncbi:MAG: cupredoxin domain-containing protein [Proteobacteria bacterium]|nr:cupredoxin domain-containing protein [Pseudomonadota bacterium]
MKSLLVILWISFMTGFHSDALAGEEREVINLTCKDGVFIPAEISAPVDKKFKLIIKNEGATAEEFESAELNREKIVAPGQSVSIFLGPLPAGVYPFFGEFHPKTAQGKLVVK